MDPNNLPMHLSANKALRLLERMQLCSPQEAKKARRFLKVGGVLEATDPLAPVLRKVWLLQLTPASPRLH